jgi:hypothetical protein
MCPVYNKPLYVCLSKRSYLATTRTSKVIFGKETEAGYYQFVLRLVLSFPHNNFVNGCMLFVAVA